MTRTSSRIIPRLLLAACLLMLVRIVLLKIPLQEVAVHVSDFSFDLARTGYNWANFVPFRTLYYYFSLQEDAPTGLRNIGGNILLFIPYGFLLPLSFSRLTVLRRLTLAVLLTSFAFELVQLLIAIGNFDVDDLMLNTLGGMIGFWIWKGLSSRMG